jgi:hypothetical protein
MNVTIFKNLGDINSPFQIPLQEALERIKSGKSKDRIESIRQKLFLGEDYSIEKKDLPFVVFSASSTQATTKINKKTGKEYLTHREDESVIEHSGVFVLDFDDCNVEMKLEQLKKDPYIYSCWVGPSGNGVKALVRCPANIESHSFYYTAFLDRYPELDPTSRNISRGTFESYDPNLWVNNHALIWDKKLTEEERRKNKDKEAGRRGAKIISTAVAMVRSSYDGVKHKNLLGAANLLGGYIATGRVSEEEAIKVLEEEIRLKNPQDFGAAQQTIRDGIEHGKSRPLLESKKIEKAQQFLRREDGSYDFMASEVEMDEYLLAVVNGTLQMGLPTGLNGLNPYWMFKNHHLVFFVGTDNVGKTFLVWYLGVLAAMFHGWKIIIHSAENGDGELRKKLMEFFMGKSVKLMDDEEITVARDFVREHFRIVSSKQMHSLDDFLLKCEILIDEGFDANVVIADPWNSFEIPHSIDTYRNNIHSLNILRVFKESYCSVWIIDHINTNAARSKDKDGYAMAPNKADAEMGVMKSNKTDDFLIIHRVGDHPYKKYDTQIHVQKIKSVETGGYRTEKDNPVILEMRSDYCGYKCNSIDPVYEYWEKNKL